MAKGSKGSAVAGLYAGSGVDRRAIQIEQYGLGVRMHFSAQRR